MELKYLQSFKRVAELEHISRAADELMTSQPALSKIIHSLEAELGVKLFNRKGKSVALNENGRILLKYTNQIMDSLDKAKMELAAANQRRNCITLAFNSASVFMPLLATRFQKEYPDINIQFSDSFEQGGHGTNCMIDSIYLSTIAARHIVPLMQERCVLAFSKNHRFAGMEAIKASDMEGETFFYSQNNHSLQDICKHFRKTGYLSNMSIIECVSSETVLSFVEADLGVAFVPLITWNLPAHPDIQTYPFDENPVYRSLVLEWEAGVELNDNAKKFEAFCKKFFRRIEDIATKKKLYAAQAVSYYSDNEA
ncbi:MAG: LysR family transcriptional regulator [Lachnospiraceae bacterium]|jgi:DNA-binding transcriptional LysR family regulator|nr:LysR family transcriptional regulator [Lachnospiraceae bacterium]